MSFEYSAARVNHPRLAGLRKLHNGFTIVELLVATTVLLIILALAFSLVSQTSDLFERTRSRIDAFQEARTGFEAMTRRISQAMLNTYWDYEPRPPATPQRYARQSELHFICGPAQGSRNLMDGTGLATIGHAIFFQAPLGQSEDTSSAALPNALNACGYFVEFGDDLDFRPRFLRNGGVAPVRHRFRLMEMVQSSEQLQVYASPTVSWFTSPLGQKPSPRRVLSENIIALIVEPTNSSDAGSAKPIAPNFAYDSRLHLTNPSQPEAELTRNQLPPRIHVTIVALDESSAIRMQAKNGTEMPELGVSSKFAKASDFKGDLDQLERELAAARIGYRVFSTAVTVLQAKWSEN